MIDLDRLPKHWEVKKLGEICRKISLNKIKVKQKSYLPQGLYPIIDQGQELIGGYYNDKNLLVPGEPPFVVFGDHTKVKKYVNFNFIAGADGVKVLQPYSCLNTKFLYYVIHCVNIPDKGYARHYQFLESSNIPLPPLLEQERIVAKIEELFSELDKGIESLQTALHQLKTYRQSVLKWAFEGKLTHDNVKEGELPQGWHWVKIDSLLNSSKKGMATGPFGTALKKNEHQKSGVPVLGIENIGEGVFRLPNKIFVTENKAKELDAFKVRYNDVIISRSGTVGEICCVPKAMENAVISTNLIRVRLNQEAIDPKFFVFCFQGGTVRDQVRELCSGSTRAFLNQTILKSIDFPYCPIKEQHDIVQQIENYFIICDKLEETIHQSLQQAETLRQSILKQAFEGKLA